MRKEVRQMAKDNSKSSGADYRSAKTGQFVKPGYAKTHPSTTVKETRKK